MNNQPARTRTGEPQDNIGYGIGRGLNRRAFLRGCGALTLGAGLGGSSFCTWGAEVKIATPSALKLGWQASVQHFVYRRFSLWETLDHVAAVGLGHLELRTNLKLDPKRPGQNADETMPAGTRKELKTALADRGLSIPSVFAEFNGQADQAKRVFECWKEFGTEVIVAEPPAGSFDVLEKLCEEYRMRLAIHNHQKGHSQYWSPDLVLAACANRSPRVGAACDNGQWARSGLDPVACLRQLQGRIVTFHLKDVLKKGEPQSRNTVMGEGEGDCARTLKELKRLNYRGLVTLDFEHDTPALHQDMARNVGFLEDQARQLLAE